VSYKEKQFNFSMPTRAAFGVGKLSNLGEEAAALGKRALVVSDKQLSGSEIFKKALESLQLSGVEAVVFNEVIPNPPDTIVYQGVEKYRQAGCDMLVAAGGGSSIDCAKAIGAIVSNGGTVKDMLDVDSVKNPLPPFIAIPTTAGTGSEVTIFSVITDSTTHEKLILFSQNLLPKVALLDPEITLGLPAEVTAGTGMDALTHAIEAYTTAVSNPISDAVACGGIELIGKFITRAYHDGSDLEARAGMLLGSHMAGIAFSNADLGSVHTLGETLGGFYDLPHGVTMAVFLPYVMEYSLDAATEKYARVAALLGEDIHGLSDLEAAHKAVEHVKALNRELKIPTLATLGVKRESFAEMAKACKSHVCDSLNPKPIDEETYLKLYEMAFKGE
jgi:alcohol dehydrogenase